MSKAKVTVKARPVAKPAKKTSPKLSTIKTKIIVREPDFFPTTVGSVAVLKACTPFDRMQMVQRHVVNHRAIVKVDCGFSMDVPTGYRVRFVVDKEFSNRGLILADETILEAGNHEVKVSVVNVGKEIILINHKQVFAGMIIEPIYLWELV